MSLILISGSRKKNRRNGHTAFVTEFYSDALKTAGMDSVLYLDLPPGDAAERFDALLLSGGDDIAPELFGETVLNDTVILDPVRDRRELALIKSFAEKKKPMFGVCRGVQLLNVFFGGTLYQDLPAQGFPVHQETAHDVLFTGFEEQFGLSGRVKVNSFHHQAVRRPGEGFQVAAQSGDGIIEALCHETLPVFGVQWHPEMPELPFTGDTADMRPLFRRFAGLAAGN